MPAAAVKNRYLKPIAKTATASIGADYSKAIAFAPAISI